MRRLPSFFLSQHELSELWQEQEMEQEFYQLQARAVLGKGFFPGCRGSFWWRVVIPPKLYEIVLSLQLQPPNLSS